MVKYKDKQISMKRKSKTVNGDVGLESVVTKGCIDLDKITQNI